MPYIPQTPRLRFSSFALPAVSVTICESITLVLEQIGSAVSKPKFSFLFYFKNGGAEKTKNCEENFWFALCSYFADLMFATTNKESSFISSCH